MLAPIGQGVRHRYGANIPVRTLTYPASATPYNASEASGVQVLSTTLAGLCPTTRVVLAGYSQGADIAADLATTAASALTGDAGAHLAEFAHTFTTATTPGTSNALGDLARQGGDAARIAASGVHQNGYTTAVQHILTWLDNRIDQTH